MEKFFKLKENNTDAKTEFIAGLTTFMTMAYILIVNPSILSAAGMDQGAVFTATALSAVIATLIMGLYAKLPFAQAPGMGLNAFFAYTIVIQMGYSFEFALTAVLLEGIIFILLTIFNVREAIVDSIPKGIKNAISVGIGLLIALIGLEGAGIVVHTDGGTIVSLGNIVSGSGLLAIIGLLITSVLIAKNVKGALFIGMIVTAIIGIPMGITPMPSKIISMPPSIAPTFFKFDFHNIFSLDMVIALFTLLFMDMFDTIGTLVGVATKAKMLDKDGKVPNIKKALFSDAVGTTLGACLGTSTVSTFVESASGVAEGGRTGLTAVSTAFMFFLALFFAPLFAVITPAVTASALVLVGLFMIEPIKEIDLHDFTEAIPAFLTIIMMPFAYSISDGIVFGVISYIILKLFTGKRKEISLTTVILGLVFLLKFLI
ncbi:MULTISPECIES: NCS2 family permease [Clostridium]|jgi:AGZA family xanthine/uracil permease-like MFS transporter|uniref:NCS2 family permease n=1 Tax=Clostridium perfringens TaxID=1502 RepID=A0A6G4ZC79_CLOPF|nr:MULTISPECIES: NCS2 family permease [Clostridium]ALG49131.1 Xanthine/uracil/thiamine/ascorbate permease family protein [Clostridium perfringens]EGT3620284.1 NCS2 family permease [Clostridium perfringens]EHK2402287.1 NCS2 family permease [Clostridium perfringens]EIF6288846.1 NCS2 family permease [Clostridium perfringens]EJT5930073.1 NCS2 family permease [Clostridium perfringens]